MRARVRMRVRVKVRVRVRVRIIVSVVYQKSFGPKSAGPMPQPQCFDVISSRLHVR